MEEGVRVGWALMCFQRGRFISQHLQSVNIDDVEAGDNPTSLASLEYVKLNLILKPRNALEIV